MESRFDWPRVNNTNPSGDVSLALALSLALLQNPDLQSFGWDVRAAEAQAIQSGLWPNPRVGFSSENHGGPASAGVRNTLRLSQLFELAGKRKKRFDLAKFDRRLAAWDYEQARLRIATETATRHIALVAAQQRVDLAKRSLGLAKQTYQIVLDRIDAGVVPTSEKDKALVRLSSERVRLFTAEKELIARRHSLAAVWGATGASFSKATGDITTIQPPLSQSATAALETNPRIARWHDEIKRQRQAVDLEKARGVQDVTVGLGLRRFEGSDDLAGIIELSAPLPVTDRNQGGILTARYRLAKAKTQHQAARADLFEQYNRAKQAYGASRFAASTLNQEAVPAARSAFEAARSSFREGRTEFINVLDAERTLIEIERQALDALESHHQSRAIVDGLMARSESEKSD